MKLLVTLCFLYSSSLDDIYQKKYERCQNHDKHNSSLGECVLAVDVTVFQPSVSILVVWDCRQICISFKFFFIFFFYYCHVIFLRYLDGLYSWSRICSISNKATCFNQSLGDMQDWYSPPSTLTNNAGIYPATIFMGTALWYCFGHFMLTAKSLSAAYSK